ncbi:hypothetical protein TeGR_g2983 [Tetraparma gracilis]|uniref:5-formyltetrahydrofolate cyclo-ligase n=1 Tax=Tetraparma gracilis TaxID=2962635 RepID=A0ABQ6M7I0_9STRA|nr:hypothetical protein TeGR_g2983 [Tetraparma gracilis]
MPSPLSKPVLSKPSLRSLVRSSIKSLPPATLSSESLRVTEHVLAMPSYQRSAAVALFLSMPGKELDTEPLLRAALAANKKVFIPRIDPSSSIPSMSFLQVTCPPSDIYSLWPRNKWSIPEPPASPPLPVAGADNAPAPDLLIVPGVAFDSGGGRLGQGKGYYDRYLARLPSMPVLVGVGLGCQMRGGERVPVDEHDVPMDYVVGPGGVELAVGIASLH